MVGELKTSDAKGFCCKLHPIVQDQSGYSFLWYDAGVFQQLLPDIHRIAVYSGADVGF